MLRREVRWQESRDRKDAGFEPRHVCVEGDALDWRVCTVKPLFEAVWYEVPLTLELRQTADQLWRAWKA
jgi:hypothetical protein